MRIVFMGSAELAVPSLRALKEAGRDEIVGVVSRPDRPAGRRRRLQACPLKAAAERMGLPTLAPERIGAPESIETLRALHPDLFAVVAYGQYVPERVLSLAPRRAVNLHPSLLPKYRGASPIQWALLQGDSETGVSIIDVAERMDAGDILLQERFPIEPDDTAASLHEKLARLGAESLLRVVDHLRAGTVRRRPQNDAEATETRKLTKEDGRIDWGLSAESLRNRIRAFDPWPGSFFLLPDGEPLKVWSADVEGGEGTPGELLDDRLLVACGAGALRLREVQPSGKRRMAASAFLNARSLPAGGRLG